MKELQLKDYLEGYHFLMACKSCGHSWKVMPETLLKLHVNAGDFYLDEIAAYLECRNRDCHSHDLRITALGQRDTHHFVGGLA